MNNLYGIKYSTRIDDQTKFNTVVWTIPNFLQLLDNLNIREIRTNKAKDCVNVDEDAKFQLKIQFVGRENDLIEIYYLTPVPAFLKTNLTYVKFYKESPIVSKEYHKVQPNKWQFLATLFKRDILSYDGRESYLDKGSLTLSFLFMVNMGIKVDYSQVPKPQLSGDLEYMLKNSLFSDVTIRSSDGTDFHVHKAVLATRSAVLKAHFEHNTLESVTNIVKSPLESEVLQEVLTYIYTDNAPKINEMPEKLLGAADFYQMSRLKSLCEEALQKNLTVENAIETLELAELHSATNLKRMILEFINDGQAKLIVKTESWDRVQSVALVKTIVEYILNSGQVEPDLR